MVTPLVEAVLPRSFEYTSDLYSTGAYERYPHHIWSPHNAQKSLSDGRPRLVSESVSLDERDRTVSDTDWYTETNYPGQRVQASDSVITGSLSKRRPHAGVWLPVTQLGTGNQGESGHGGGS